MPHSASSSPANERTDLLIDFDGHRECGQEKTEAECGGGSQYNLRSGTPPMLINSDSNTSAKNQNTEAVAKISDRNTRNCLTDFARHAAKPRAAPAKSPKLGNLEAVGSVKPSLIAIG
jgi:hypothetical protein